MKIKELLSNTIYPAWTYRRKEGERLAFYGKAAQMD
jgi:hypothetical protein